MRVRHDMATLEDVEELLSIGVPESNAREITRVGCLPVDKAIYASFTNSEVRTASRIGDDLVALWGVRRKSLLSPDAYVWLVASKHIGRHRLAFAKESRRILRVITDDFPRLENFVDSGNEKIIEWLRWLGFQLDPQAVTSPLGHKLYRFWR